MIITVYALFENRYGEVDVKKSEEHINVSEIIIRDDLISFEAEDGKTKAIGIRKNREIRIYEVR